MVIKTVNDNKRGICFKRLKTNTVSIASFGILPLAAKRNIITALWAITMPDNIRIVDSDV
jgi:di/tricarboxylate transporter